MDFPRGPFTHFIVIFQPITVGELGDRCLNFGEHVCMQVLEVPARGLLCHLAICRGILLSSAYDARIS